MISRAMSCTQTNICLTNAGIFFKGPNPRIRRASCYAQPRSSCPTISSVYVSASSSFQHYNASKCKRLGPVCARDEKGNPKDENWAFPWDPLKKAMGSLGQEKSLEGLLRKQMQERDFSGDGSDKNPPGGGGDDGDGSGGSDDGGLVGIFDELLQVILAIIGFIFVYIYILRGPELSRLAKDYIRSLFGAKPSMRLKYARWEWRTFYEKITERQRAPRPGWLGRAIAITRTSWPNQRSNLVKWITTRRRKSPGPNKRRNLVKSITRRRRKARAPLH